MPRVKSKLVEIRDNLGITQNQLAEWIVGNRSDLEFADRMRLVVKIQVNISRVENGHQSLTIDRAVEIIRVLKTQMGVQYSIDDLVEYDVDEGKLRANSTKELMPEMA